MEHPVDLVVHVVGYVVGNAIAKRGMQNTETWFLWVIVVVLVLAVYYDGGATYRQAVQTARVDPTNNQNAVAFEVLRNLSDAVKAILAWIVIRTLRTLVNWMLGIEEAVVAATTASGDPASASGVLPYLFLAMIITAMFAVIEVLGLGRSGKVLKTFKKQRDDEKAKTPPLSSSSTPANPMAGVEELGVVKGGTT